MAGRRFAKTARWLSCSAAKHLDGHDEQVLAALAELAQPK
jgi:hypothetical protein